MVFELWSYHSPTDKIQGVPNWDARISNSKTLSNATDTHLTNFNFLLNNLLKARLKTLATLLLSVFTHNEFCLQDTDKLNKNNILNKLDIQSINKLADK